MSYILFTLAALSCPAAPAAERAAPSREAVRPPENPTVARALEVLDSLIPLSPPRSVPAVQARDWAAQTTWFCSLRDRLRNLTALVVAPAKQGEVHPPIDPRNLEALQKEAEFESRKFTAMSRALKTRHDVAMNAIRNLK